MFNPESAKKEYKAYNPLERFPDHVEDIEKIRTEFGAISDKMYTPEITTPFTPGKKFEYFIKKKHPELNVENFCAYHIAAGSSPDEKQDRFDTEDGLIMKAFDDFLTLSYEEMANLSVQ